LDVPPVDLILKPPRFTVDAAALSSTFVSTALDSMKKELKSLNKNELINVMVAVIGYGAIYDNENVNKVIVKEAEIGAFNTLVKVEMDKINMIIETLTLEAMSRNTEEGNNESQEQQQE